MSYVEKITRLARLNFSRFPNSMRTPHLLETQKESYKSFLQMDVAANKRKNEGLEGVFKSIFPIQGNNSNTTLEYLGYELHEPLFSAQECRARDKTYAAPLRIKTRLVMRDASGEVTAISKKDDGQIYVGDIPLMTDRGSFIINGTERVIVSQLHRSPWCNFQPNGKQKQRRQKDYLFS